MFPEVIELLSSMSCPLPFSYPILTLPLPIPYLYGLPWPNKSIDTIFDFATHHHHHHNTYDPYPFLTPSLPVPYPSFTRPIPAWPP